ncbi:hypothetical protein F5Y11DRAFT_9509 [Daldinia sp. FL1419]|nr:hypothetical protein F5Y11DRAFT_9509 [Daldinia sp. FL1419]
MTQTPVSKRPITQDDVEYWARENPNRPGCRPEIKLLSICQSLAPVALRISWAEEAIATDLDVNQLLPHSSRPLQEAIENPQNHDWRLNIPLDHYESLDMVRWLLDHGADPRLRDWVSVSAIDEALINKLRNKDSPTAEFYDQARKMMIEAARKLEAEKEAAEMGIVDRCRELFGTGKYFHDHWCVLCRRGYLGHKKGERKENCEYCKEEKELNWRYNRAEALRVLSPGT